MTDEQRAALRQAVAELQELQERDEALSEVREAIQARALEAGLEPRVLHSVALQAGSKHRKRYLREHEASADYLRELIGEEGVA